VKQTRVISGELEKARRDVTRPLFWKEFRTSYDTKRLKDCKASRIQRTECEERWMQGSQ
jgi:hypothetical protein